MRRNRTIPEATFLDGQTDPPPYCQQWPERCIRLAQIAHLGGEAVKQSRGRAYFRELGKAGFQAYADRQHGGNRSAAAANLAGRGKLR